MTLRLQPEEDNRGERPMEIAVSYLTFGGIVAAAALLLMKCVVALQSLGALSACGL